MAESNFQLSTSSARDAHELPSDFTFLKLLGEGSYGKVLQCLKKDTRQTVAVKIPLSLERETAEVSTMENLMLLKLDQHNIVQFLGWFHTSCGKAMVFESLDISLEDFILQRNCAPMLLSDVRGIIQQLATAFEALKFIGVIHTDLKLDNVMMVDHRRQPLGVKLIDFGLAIHRSKARQGTTMQTFPYRAPEIILGLPFTEAIDIWSLGCVMAVMLHGGELFPGDTEYEVLQDINALLGVPDDHLLDKGLKTEKYFTRTECSSWRLKTHEECGRNQQYETFSNTLDTFRRARLEKDNKLEAVQRPRCIDLLEAMLSLDEADRITPFQILTHPFITGREHSSNNKETHTETKTTTNDLTEQPPGVILVHPASAENRLLQDTDEELSDVSEEPPAALGKDDDMETDCSSPILSATPPGVILVRPATAENTLPLDIDEEVSDVSEEPPVALEKDDDMETGRCSPSPRATPPGVILVRPATAENTLQQEEEDRAVRLPAGMKTYSVERTDRDTTPRTRDFTETQNKTEQKKTKKNCVRRFFSWMKKNFGSCCSSTSDDQDN